MATTDQYAVIGNPIAHSRSPQIHHLFAAQTHQSLSYTRILADERTFIPTVKEFFASGGKGLNVTVPFKLQAFELAQPRLSPRATAAGAVNTLWQEAGNLHGCNTDGIGLVRDLTRLGIELHGARLLLVGAGGAARGVMLPLLEAGCAHIHVVNRTPERATELVHRFQTEAQTARLSSGGLESSAPQDAPWDIVINASASSLADTAPPLASGTLEHCAWAYDMMYGPTPTPFLLQAAAAGANTADGLGMLVEQAAESFAIWRGVRANSAPVLATLRTALSAGIDADADLTQNFIHNSH